MIISERIFELLKEKGISQKTFSQETGISQSTISDWKTKKTNPAADKIMSICLALQVSPSELLSAGNENLRSVIIDDNSAEYELVSRYRTLKEGQRQRLMGYLDALSEDT